MPPADNVCVFNRSARHYQLNHVAHFHYHLLPDCKMAALTGPDWASHRIRAVRSRLGASLVRRGERRRLVDDNRTPLHLSWGRRRRGEAQQLELALLAQAVVSQRSWRTEGLQRLGIFILGVGGRAGGSACSAETVDIRKSGQCVPACCSCQE